jgi:anaerobic ribonucleoside-triphosphate reductase activating protein
VWWCKTLTVTGRPQLTQCAGIYVNVPAAPWWGRGAGVIPSRRGPGLGTLASMPAGGSLTIAQIVAETDAEGPGRRFAVWVQGCPMRCQECCNPQMLRFEGGEKMSVPELVERALGTSGIEGVSLLGGEPFAQAEGCAAFAEAVRTAGLSVMVYSGFTRAELETKRDQGDAGVGTLLDACDLLVDGRYERDRPEPQRRWIGSTNQVMHFLSDRYRPDDPRMRTGNTVEIRLRKGELLVNGWPALAAAVTEKAKKKA